MGVISSNKSKIVTLVSNNVPSSYLTGTTTNTQINSFFVPKGTIPANSLISFKITSQKVGTAGQFIPNILFNTVNSLTGATTISSTQSGNNAALYGVRLSYISISNGSTISRVATTVLGNFLPYQAVSENTITYNISRDFYIIFALRNTNSTDSTRILNYSITLYI